MEIEIDGFPLSDLGLEDAVLVGPDGKRGPLPGFFVANGETIVTALRRALACLPGHHIEISGQRVGFE